MRGVHPASDMIFLPRSTLPFRESWITRRLGRSLRTTSGAASQTASLSGYYMAPSRIRYSFSPSCTCAVSPTTGKTGVSQAEPAYSADHTSLMRQPFGCGRIDRRQSFGCSALRQQEMSLSDNGIGGRPVPATIPTGGAALILARAPGKTGVDRVVGRTGRSFRQGNRPCAAPRTLPGRLVHCPWWGVRGGGSRGPARDVWPL